MKNFKELPATKESIYRRRPAYGVGINDANYITHIKHQNKWLRCPFYAKWKGMLMRCYSDKFHKTHPTYIDCNVSEEWKVFSNFRAWMQKQDWRGNELDKDILFIGNKLYSSETCVFISPDINKLLTNREAKKGNFPVGVHKINNKYMTRCNLNGKRIFLGSYETISQASHTYRNFKSSLIIKIAMKQIDLILRDALLTHAENIRIGDL